MFEIHIMKDQWAILGRQPTPECLAMLDLAAFSFKLDYAQEESDYSQDSINVRAQWS